MEVTPDPNFLLIQVGFNVDVGIMEVQSVP